MNEKTFLLSYHIITGIKVLLYGACMTGFLCPFLAKSLPEGRNLRRRRLTVFLVYAAPSLSSMFLPGRGWLYRAVMVAALMACAGFLGLERKLLLLLSILFFCTQNLSMLSLQSLDYISCQFWQADADTREKVYSSAVVNYAFIASLELALSCLLLCLLKRLLAKRELELHIRELCYLLLTPVTGILFVNIALQILLVPGEDSIFQLYSQVPAAIAVIPILAALFYAAILAAIAACQRIIGLQEEHRKHFVVSQQLAALQERMAQTAQFEDSLRRMKHEMKNHLTNLQGLAQRGCYEEMGRYIARMDQDMPASGPEIPTGNAVTDVIISDRKNAAVRSGIGFQADFRYPSPGGFDAYDIGIILSNLLQNALEACEKMKERGQRYILLSGRQKKNFFLIEVRNSFQGAVRFDRRTGLPVSTKQEAGSHGIGLSNVRQVAEKYQGDVDIQVTEQEFCVTVLLQGKAAEKG